MRTAEQLLDDIDATEEERDLLAEACRRMKEKAAWERRKRADKSMPRQAQFPGPTAAKLLDGAFGDLPSERFVVFMEALRAMECFE